MISIVKCAMCKHETATLRPELPAYCSAACAQEAGRIARETVRAVGEMLADGKRAVVKVEER